MADDERVISRIIDVIRTLEGMTPDVLAKVSRGLGEAMVGINVEEIPQPHRLAERGW